MTNVARHRLFRIAGIALLAPAYTHARNPLVWRMYARRARVRPVRDLDLNRCSSCECMGHDPIR